MVSAVNGYDGSYASSSKVDKKPVQKINKKTATVKAGQSVQLKVKNLKKKKKDGKYKIPKIKWRSSDEKIATVSKTGNVRTLRIGKATITAKVGKKKYKCVITTTYPNYSISAKSKPIDPKLKKNYAYNKYTNNYFTIRSYLELFERCKGGTLTINAGKYDICNALYVPSNVTIILNSGAELRKTFKTGSSLVAPKGMFYMCAPSRGKACLDYKKGKYKNAYKEYKGVKNVRLIGYGTATINNQNKQDAISIIMGHNDNITVSNITFRNMNYGHFIELNSSKNVTISGCTFMDGKGDKEAIGVDTTDLKTGGFNCNWSSFDGTSAKDATIVNNKFRNLYTAIGSHSYTKDKPHTNIKVTNNNIEGMKSDGISTMHWKNCEISGNTIKDVRKNGSGRGIKGAGTVNLTISGNTFSNMDRVAQFYPVKKHGYNTIYPDISEKNLHALCDTNTFLWDSIGSDQVRINEWNEIKGTTAWENYTAWNIITKEITKVGYP